MTTYVTLMCLKCKTKIPHIVGQIVIEQCTECDSEKLQIREVL